MNSEPGHGMREHVIFYVGEDAEHHHVVQQTRGAQHNFSNREEAICFAQSSAAGIPGAIVMIAPRLVPLAR